MGVQVAKSDLAAAVAKTGAIGCISSVGLGTLEASLDNYILESNRKLTAEIRRARQLAPNRIIGVNAMCALFNYNEIVRVCVEEKVDIIMSGAGLPLSLPELTRGSDIKIIPIISSGRSLAVVLKAWHRRYQRMPDAVIIEGPLCGGHMGFSFDDLAHPERVSIESILADIRAVLVPYEAEYGRAIPVLGAEAIADAGDVLAMLAKGFDGVQVGTRFICTEESGLDPKSKDVFVKARDCDVRIIESPLGLPVKVLNTPLVQKLARHGKVEFGCPFLCLRACKAEKAHFCLADALVHTRFGNVEEGLYMTGSAIGRINDIIPAEEFFVPLRKLL
jgi:NAD(P)H-dependent flavin oxidoreductase YrpB (nitropropane dioxygenase family)